MNRQAGRDYEGSMKSMRVSEWMVAVACVNE